jgi:hypothetical protein
MYLEVSIDTNVGSSALSSQPSSIRFNISISVTKDA